MLKREAKINGKPNEVRYSSGSKTYLGHNAFTVIFLADLDAVIINLAKILWDSRWQHLLDQAEWTTGDIP